MKTIYITLILTFILYVARANNLASENSIHYYTSNIISLSNKATQDSITVKIILDNYLEAIGGKENIKSVYNIVSQYNSKVDNNGQKINIEAKKIVTDEGQYFLETSLFTDEYSTINLISIDTNNGFSRFNGSRKELSKSQIEDFKKNIDKKLFLELQNPSNFKLIGVEVINGFDVYIVENIHNMKKSYYSIETGLKIKETQITEMNGQTLITIIEHFDYRPIESILFPFRQIETKGDQIYEINYSEIKINQYLSEDTFR